VYLVALLREWLEVSAKNDVMKKLCIFLFCATLAANDVVLNSGAVPSTRKKSRAALQEEIVSCIEVLLDDSRGVLRVCAQRVKDHCVEVHDGDVLCVVADIQEMLLASVRELLSHDKKWSVKLKKDLECIVEEFRVIHQEVSAKNSAWNNALKERLIKIC
jgi:hypothetical protein